MAAAAASTSPFTPSLLTLHLIPLLSSTAALMFAFDQHFFLSTIMSSPQISPSHTARILPTYFNILSRQHLPRMLALNTITLGCSLWTLHGYWRANATPRRLKQLSGPIYCMIGGVVFLLGHSAFSALLEPLVGRIAERDDGGLDNLSEYKDRAQEGVAVLMNAREWLSGHTRRLILADVPSWLCFLFGALQLSRI